MATIKPVIVRSPSALDTQVLFTWALVNAGDVGAPIKLEAYSEQTWQVYGTTITSVALNGSLDIGPPANWAAMRDYTGGSLGALATAGIYSPRDRPVWVQPVLTTGSTVTFALLAHRFDVTRGN